MAAPRLAVVGLVLAFAAPSPAAPLTAESLAPSVPTCPGLPTSPVVVVGRSVQGRPIRAYRIGDVNEPVRFLVVGAIAGDEPGGVDAARDLLARRPARGVVMWVILTVNPDGLAAATRQNARGVDLNRNFPWHWRALGRRGYRFYAGPRPLSEPESRAVLAFILRIRPDVTIWFHQPYGLVERRGDASLRIERRFAGLIGLPLRPLPPLPGIVIGWQNNTLRPSTALDAELYDPLPAGGALHAAAAVIALARWAARAIPPSSPCAPAPRRLHRQPTIGAAHRGDHAGRATLA
jgi:murein peptide amidase A